MLFNEPKLLKLNEVCTCLVSLLTVSVLFNEPKLLKYSIQRYGKIALLPVSVLFNEPKLLKWGSTMPRASRDEVSVLFNEPKLLKSSVTSICYIFANYSFSALQRAEIAEIMPKKLHNPNTKSVSVLFNEPKLLKCVRHRRSNQVVVRFSALQRAEIAEMCTNVSTWSLAGTFQCSSTSRNC